MSSFNRDVIFIGEGTSKNFYEVLPKNLTLQSPMPKHLHESFMGYNHDTIFREVTFNEYAQTKETEKFLITEHKKISGIEELYDVLKNVIEKAWDPTKTHVIGHSSGYDSRVISQIVKELGAERGDAWLGEVIYIETLGEGEGFKRIMEEQGLTGIVYNKGVSPERYHDYSFNFKTFYQKFNGVVSFPINQWYDAYRDLEEQGVLNSSNVQCFTGYGANETQEIAHKKKGFAHYFRWHHYLQIQRFKLWGEAWVHPFWDYEVMGALAGLPESKKWKLRIGQVMADTMVPHLKHIARQTLESLGKNRTRYADPKLLERVVVDYRNSWYGKQVPVAMCANFTNYYNWWMHYCIASMCEHLLENGYKIKIG